MFEYAVEAVAKFTRPVHTIMKSYGSVKVLPGSATLFFVNESGVAVTCRHVAEQLINVNAVNAQYAQFVQARFRLRNDERHAENLKILEDQFNYKPETIVQVKNNFINCFDKITGFECHLHPLYDLAIIKFKGFQQQLYDGFATFIADTSVVKQGKSVCRLGYPFPEFNNYKYDYQTDEIVWTKEGINSSPSFPIDGIITRMIGQNNRIAGIEISTPGLRGQSGGPLFDKDGIIYGMQSATRHLHLGFDLVNFEIASGSGTKRITNTPFLHVGQCVHAEVIKEFLTEHNVKFYKAQPAV